MFWVMSLTAVFIACGIRVRPQRLLKTCKTIVTAVISISIIHGWFIAFSARTSQKHMDTFSVRESHSCQPLITTRPLKLAGWGHWLTRWESRLLLMKVSFLFKKWILEISFTSSTPSLLREVDIGQHITKLSLDSFCLLSYTHSLSFNLKWYFHFYIQMLRYEASSRYAAEYCF